MAASRKRSKKATSGTAGKKKTAQRKSPATKARTKTTGRVKGARGGPATREHPQSEPTKRASSRRRAAEAGDTLSNKRAQAARHETDVTEADVQKIPSLARARAKDTGESTTSGKPSRAGAKTKRS
ncbi:MAG TPA: hypothetical protein VK669_13915 [Candidatus Limnocylindrales bacterium]|nr:hypothetical protein [Candidatus Limnocylindrales bacterium]